MSKRSTGRARAVILPAGAIGSGSSTTGVARDNAITVISGNVSGSAGGPVIWPLRTRRVLKLTAHGAHTEEATFGVAHGSGNTFYVAGEVRRPDLSVDTHGVV
jgi:hypothetical protein